MYLLPQTVINKRYRILSQVGQGGMGTVYKSQDRLTQKTVALKLLQIPSKTTSDETQVGSASHKLALINEFKILAGLRRPNIISVYDYGLHNDFSYIVMDYLSDAVEFDVAISYASEQEKISLLMQVLEALSYLHRRGIIHRDLKPSNIMVEQAKVKVLDFGLSVVDEMVVGRAGTLAYMAPETLGNRVTVPQSDLYSLGVIAYEAFTDTLPFKAGDIMGIINEYPDMLPLEGYSIEPIIERLLLKSPLDRYQSASDTLHAFTQTLNIAYRETVSIRESFLQASKFVGREDELNQLKDALDDAMFGQGSSWLIGGESGVGKSRLFDEFRTHALIKGAVVLQGVGIEEGGLPYQLWHNIVRHLLLSTEINTLEASILKELIPDIAELVEQDVADAPILQGEAKKIRLITTITDILRRQTECIVLLLEDLQWVDESLDVIKKLTFFVRDMPLLIVGNFRNDERPKLVEELPTMQVLQLQRLSDTDMSVLVKSMLGEHSFQDKLLTFLKKETEGNAFFMVEVVRTLAENSSQLSDISQVTLPEEVYTGNINRIIQKRLSNVPQDYQKLLHSMAILGRYVDIEVMRILEDETGINLDDLLLICNDLSILEVANDTWRFAHDKLREGTIQSIPEKDIQPLYMSVAQSVERIYSDDEKYAGILLDLWYKAGHQENELHYIMIEGKRLNEQAGFSNAQQAKTLYQRAEILAQAVKASSETQLDIDLEMGVASIGTQEFDVADTYLAQALHIADDINEKLKASKAMVGLARIRMASSPQSDVLDLLNQAIEIANDYDDHRMLGVNYGMQGYIHAHYNDFDKALDAFLVARDALKEANIDYEVALMLNNIGKLLQVKGDFAEAKSQLQESRRLSLKAGHYNNLILCTSNLGTTSFFQGEYQDAITYYSESIKLMTDTADIAGLPHLWILKSLAEAEIGDVETVRESIENAIQTRQKDVLWEYSNTYIVIGGVRLLLLVNELEKASMWFGLAKKHGDNNPFIREWLDPLEFQLLTLMSKSELDHYMVKGNDLELDATVDKIEALQIAHS